jgi:hypothetical protein
MRRQPNEVREMWKPLCDIQVPYCKLYFGNDDIFFSVYLSDNSFQGEAHLNTIKKLGSNCDD